MFIIGFFLPSLTVTLGWIVLLHPDYGLLNQSLKSLLGLRTTPFNVYSFWGIVWVHLAGGTLAGFVMLLTAAFRSIDGTLEEAARASGSSPLGALLRIIVPIMTPVLSTVLLLAIIYSLQSFEIELVLGPPIKLFVFSTQIYEAVQAQPPEYSEAMALSAVVLVALLPLILIHRWLTRRRRFATMGSHFKSVRLKLRAWRWPVFALIASLLLLVTIVPLGLLLMTTFMQLTGFFDLASAWTFSHWGEVASDPVFVTSVINMLRLGTGAIVLGLVLSLAVAYVVMRTRFVARDWVDLASWIPLAFPSIILGLGLLWLFLGSPILRGLYGTMALLVIAAVVSVLPTTVQLLKANFFQLGLEFEEAARVEGGSWLHSIRHVLLPLMAPTLLLVATISFMNAVRNVASIALLATSSTRPLSLLQLDLAIQGNQEAAAVVGVIIVLITTMLVLGARILGLGTWESNGERK
jgi:iron(III) transport system permease protein